MLQLDAFWLTSNHANEQSSLKHCSHCMQACLRETRCEPCCKQLCAYHMFVRVVSTDAVLVVLLLSALIRCGNSHCILQRRGRDAETAKAHAELEALLARISRDEAQLQPVQARLLHCQVRPSEHWCFDKAEWRLQSTASSMARLHCSVVRLPLLSEQAVENHVFCPSPGTP